jgi:hypothetical protein
MRRRLRNRRLARRDFAAEEIRPSAFLLVAFLFLSARTSLHAFVVGLAGFAPLDSRGRLSPHGHSAGGQRRSELRLYELLCRFAAAADAVWHADAAVGIACQSQAGELLAQAVDAVEAIEVSDTVLRHGGLPLIDAGE